MTQELPHGVRGRLEELFNNLRQGVLYLRRLHAHKLSAEEISVGTVKEAVSGGGTIIDGVLKVDVINENTAAAGVTVESVLLEDGFASLSETSTPSNPSQNTLTLFARASGNDIQLVALSSQGVEAVLTTLLDASLAPPTDNVLTLNWIE